MARLRVGAPARECASPDDQADEPKAPIQACGALGREGASGRQGREEGSRDVAEGQCREEVSAIGRPAAQGDRRAQATLQTGCQGCRRQEGRAAGTASHRVGEAAARLGHQLSAGRLPHGNQLARIRNSAGTSGEAVIARGVRPCPTRWPSRSARSSALPERLCHSIACGVKPNSWCMATAIAVPASTPTIKRRKPAATARRLPAKKMARPMPRRCADPPPISPNRIRRLAQSIAAPAHRRRPAPGDARQRRARSQR